MHFPSVSACLLLTAVHVFAQPEPFSSLSITSISQLAFNDLECLEDIEYASTNALAQNATLLVWSDVEAVVRAYRDTWMPVLTQTTHWPLQQHKKLFRRIGGLLAEDVTLPFVQKLLLPAGSRVALFGDLHGSLHSFLRVVAGLARDGWLRADFTVSCADCFLVFMGDYVDRGPHGAEVLAILLLLKSRSPDRVFMVRGNHEDAAMHVPEEGGTFIAELRAKFPAVRARRMATLFRIYETLPMAIAMGVVPAGNDSNHDSARFILAVHGGIEIGHDLRPLLQAAAPAPLPSGAVVAFEPIHGLYRAAWLAKQPAHIRERIPASMRSLFHNIGPLKKLRELLNASSLQSEAVPASTEPIACAGSDCNARRARKASAREQQHAHEAELEYPTAPTGTEPPNGYMWWDFIASLPGSTDAGPFVTYREGRGFAFGKALTQHALAEAGLVAVFRAHQHNDKPASGPMMTCVRDARGIFDNWNDSGLALTWLTGAHIPGMQFPYDSYGVLHLTAEMPSSWRLRHCVNAVGAPVRTDAAGTVTRKCDSSHDFTCTTTLWRTHASAAAAGSHNIEAS